MKARMPVFEEEPVSKTSTEVEALSSETVRLRLACLDAPKKRVAWPVKALCFHQVFEC